MDEKKRPHGSGEGTYYRLEARSSTARPKIIYQTDERLTPIVLTQEWQEISTHPVFSPIPNTVNVPNNVHHLLAHEQGLLTYEAARTHERLFIARLGWDNHVETRLVQIKFKYNFEELFEGYSDVLNNDDEGRRLREAIRNAHHQEQP